MSAESKHDQALTLVGAGVIAVGVWFILERLLGDLLAPVRAVIDATRGMGWGLALVIAGVALIVYTKRPGFRAPAPGARLLRSRRERLVSGVFGGLALYLSVDPTFLRLAFVAFTLLFGLWPGLVAYVAASIIIPEGPEAPPASGHSASVGPPPPPPPPAPPE